MENNLEDVSLSEMVDLYNSASPAMPTYHEIENRILSLGYIYPQTYMDLEEEDASEFILFLHSSIPQIVKNYDLMKGEFENYFAGVLKLQIKAFNRQRMKDYRTRKILEQSVGCNNRMVLSEPDLTGKSEEAKRLKYILAHSNSCRRRVFILLLSLSPFNTMDMLYDLCNETSIDFLEFLQFREQLVILCKPTIEHLERMKDQRTAYYSEYMVDSSNCMVKEAERKLHYLGNKNRQISSLQKRASYQDLAEILELSPGTVGNYLHLARLLLEWVQDPTGSQFSGKELSIKDDLYEYIRTSGRSKIPSDRRLPQIFHPIEEFTLKKVDQAIKSSQENEL